MIRCGSKCIGLYGIDAPEIGGRCRHGRVRTPGDPDASNANLKRLVARGPVGCVQTGTNRYRRVLARCEVGGIDFPCEIVRANHALERYGVLKCE